MIAGFTSDQIRKRDFVYVMTDKTSVRNVLTLHLKNFVLSVTALPPIFTDNLVFSSELESQSYLFMHTLTIMCKLRGQDLNLRPSGYEPDELPDCSTPRQYLVLMMFSPNGWRWIRTTEAICSRFTVCPLWPLGNPSMYQKYSAIRKPYLLPGKYPGISLWDTGGYRPRHSPVPISISI